MSEEKIPNHKNWWTTLPGVLTSIATFVTAITGLIIALNTIRKPADTSTGAKTEVSAKGSSPVTPAPKHTIRKDHQVVNRSSFKVPLTPGSRLHYYDIDAAQELDARGSEVDFFFKPDDSKDPKSKIGVGPMNGARYAARFPGLLPWEVDPGKFTSSGGVYSVGQGENIPCYTSENRPCTFLIRVEPQGELFVSFALYR